MDCPKEGGKMGERSGQVKSMFTQGQGRFNQTAIRLTPTGEQDEPVLDNGEEEFGETLVRICQGC